ncbi:MAG: hypothetical protein U0174_14305 [Polyangiaceae bacterium]
MRSWFGLSASIVTFLLVACGSERAQDDDAGAIASDSGIAPPLSDGGAPETGVSMDGGLDAKGDAAKDSGGGNDGGVGPQSRRLTLGLQTACALSPTGTVKCWGFNGYAALGIGDKMNRGDDPNEMGSQLPVVSLGAGRTVRQVSAGGTFTCAILDTGNVKCWGHSDINGGQTGLGEYEERGDEPGEMGDALATVQLGTGRTALALATGHAFACAILDDRSLKCWGSNSSGQLGLGDMQARGDAPGEMGDALPTVDLGTGRKAMQVAAGAQTACALLDDDSVKCWGSGYEGGLGSGSTQDRGSSPGQMGNALPALAFGTGRKARQIGVGAQFGCARLDDGSVKCWGYNQDGQLGLGDTQIRGDAPGEMGDALPAVALGAGRTAVDIRVGFSHACALLDNGALKCWGYNTQGMLGQGDENDRGIAAGQMGDALPPIALGTGRSVKDFALGTSNTCALLDNDDIKCWGGNNSGQLGLGDKTARGRLPNQMGDNLPPVPVW